MDWIADSGMQVWQILPMVLPDPMFYSPYSGTDANCGNPLTISLEDLVRDGLLEAGELPPSVPVGDVDFAAVAASKLPLLSCAANRLLTEERFKQIRGEMDAWR